MSESVGSEQLGMLIDFVEFYAELLPTFGRSTKGRAILKYFLTKFENFSLYPCCRYVERLLEVFKIVF